MGDDKFSKGDYPEMPKDLNYSKYTDHPEYPRDSNPFAEIVINHVLIERTRKNREKKKPHPLQLKESDITVTSKDISIMSRNGQMYTENGELIIYDKTWEDEESFVKIYTGMLGYFYDLSGTASRIYLYLMKYVEQEMTLISFDLRDISEDLNLTKATIYKGLNELCNRNFLKKTDRTHMVHINPLFMFNGKRKRMKFIHDIEVGDEDKALEETNRLLNYNKPKVLNPGDKDYDKESDDIFGE